MVLINDNHKNLPHKNKQAKQRKNQEIMKANKNYENYQYIAVHLSLVVQEVGLLVCHTIKILSFFLKH